MHKAKIYINNFQYKLTQEATNSLTLSVVFSWFFMGFFCFFLFLLCDHHGNRELKHYCELSVRTLRNGDKAFHTWSGGVCSLKSHHLWVTGHLRHLDRSTSGERHCHKYQNEVQMPWIWLCQKNMSTNTLSFKGSNIL